MHKIRTWGLALCASWSFACDNSFAVLPSCANAIARAKAFPFTQQQFRPGEKETPARQKALGVYQEHDIPVRLWLKPETDDGHGEVDVVSGRPRAALDSVTTQELLTGHTTTLVNGAYVLTPTSNYISTQSVVPRLAIHDASWNRTHLLPYERIVGIRIAGSVPVYAAKDAVPRASPIQRFRLVGTWLDASHVSESEPKVVNDIGLRMTKLSYGQLGHIFSAWVVYEAGRGKVTDATRIQYLLFPDAEDLATFEKFLGNTTLLERFFDTLQ